MDCKKEMVVCDIRYLETDRILWASDAKMALSRTYFRLRFLYFSGSGEQKK